MPSYSYQQKLDILNSGASPDNIPTSTLGDWRRDELNIIAIVQAGHGHVKKLVSIICNYTMMTMSTLILIILSLIGC